MRSGDLLLVLAAYIAGALTVGFPLGIFLHWLKRRRQWNKIIKAVETPVVKRRPPPSLDNVSILQQRKPNHPKEAA